MLANQNAVSNALNNAAGNTVPEDLENSIRRAGSELVRAGKAPGTSPYSFSNLYKNNKDQSNEGFEAATLSLLNGINNRAYIGLVEKKLNDFYRIPNQSIVQIVDTKTRAELELAGGTRANLQHIIDSLPYDENGNEKRRYLQQNFEAILERSVSDTIQEHRSTIKATDEEKRAANLIRKKQAADNDILRRQIEGSQVGLSPAFTDGLNEVLDQANEIVRLGPDGFAEKIQNMPAPTELSVAKQKIQGYLDEITNPTDPLSASVGRFLAEVPFVENYMAAMGFKSPLQTARYLRDHPEEFEEYYRIASRIGSTEDAGQLSDPMAIRERLRVAGSSNATSMFRRKNLTKPIERLLGIGINRPEAMRYFSGTNTAEQLDAAQQALREDPEKFKGFVDRFSGGPGPDVEQPTKEAASGALALAQSIPDEKKKERIARAADRFRRRIGVDTGEGPEGGGRFVLPGLSTQMMLDEPEPEPQPQVAAPVAEQKPKGRKNSFSSRIVPTTEQIQAQKDAEEAEQKRIDEVNKKRDEAKAAKLAADKEQAAEDKAALDRDIDNVSEVDPDELGALESSDVDPREPAAPKSTQGDPGTPNVTKDDEKAAAKANLGSFKKDPKTGKLTAVERLNSRNP